MHLMHVQRTGGNLVSFEYWYTILMSRAYFRICIASLFALQFSFVHAQQQLGTQCQIDPKIDGGGPMQQSGPRIAAKI
jgi:hypothetical protein